ncbi:MAG: exo-alpha-sialidase [Pirellulales bacterium]|nr:exo-alpha-sialidase [Pirellulales bacterium]
MKIAACTLSLVVLLVASPAQSQETRLPAGAAPKTAVGKMTGTGHWITDGAEELKLPHCGPLVRLGDGRLLVISGGRAFASPDEGKTWEEQSSLLKDAGQYAAAVGRSALRTKKGTILVPFMNTKKEKWTWTVEQTDAPGAVLPTCVVRSTDEGKTWLEPQTLHDDWTGDLSAILQTRSGRIVLTSMRLLHSPGRHTVLTYYSDDEGATWKSSHVLDLGGSGDHDGTMEAALEELTDGRLWMLIRTNWDKFWNAWSDDGGASWRSIAPSRIDASSSPAFLRRLASGRIALVWNRCRPQNVLEIARRGGDGQVSAVPASWHREELSLALSGDDGRTWTDPVVIARKPGGNVSYPYLFEPKPGVLWVFAVADGLQVSLQEKDFVVKGP